MMFKTKKILAFLLASAMMTAAFTACGGSSDSSKDSSSVVGVSRAGVAFLAAAGSEGQEQAQGQ